MKGNSWKEYLEKIKGKKEQWLILFLIGILLLVIAIPVSDEKKEEKEAVQVSRTNDNSYVSGMERKLETVLQNVKGVGRVSVMITIAETSEKIIEKDEETSAQTTTENGTRTDTSTERTETSIFSGEETPYVKKEISPQVEGVLVVADGGDNAVVIENITGAVQALFGIESHKIKVMKHN